MPPRYDNFDISQIPPELLGPPHPSLLAQQPSPANYNMDFDISQIPPEILGPPHPSLMEPQEVPQESGGDVPFYLPFFGSMNVGKNKLKGGAATFAQGATANLSDEALAGIQALGPSEYEDNLAEQRALLENFRKENPNMSLGLELAGSFLPGGAALKGAKGAIGAGKQILRGAGIGAATGTAYGFGGGEGGEERYHNALTGLFGGGAFGAAAGAVGPGLTAAAQSRPARAIRDRFTGSKLSRAEKVIGERISNIPTQDIQAATHLMDETLPTGAQLLPAEALDKPSLYRFQKLLSHEDPSTDVAQKFMEPRKVGRQGRILESFDNFAPERSVEEGATLLRGAGQDTIEAAKTLRKEKSAPYYKKAHEEIPLIENEKAQQLLQSGPAQSVIKSLKTDFPHKYGKLPDNHFTMIDKVKKRLGGLVDEAKRKGNKEESLDLMELKKLAEGSIEDMGSVSHAYKEANKIFKEHSALVNTLEGNEVDGLRGILTDLVSTNEINIESAGAKLFAAPAAKIRQVRTLMGEGRREQFNAGVRSYLQNIVEKTKDGQNPLKQFIGSEQGRKKLQAALGVPKYRELKKALDLEERMIKGESFYTPLAGSQTQIVQGEKANLLGLLDRALGGGAALMQGRPITALRSAFKGGSGFDDKLVKEMAEILYNPQQGNQSFKNIVRQRGVTDRYDQGVNQILRDGIPQYGALGAGVMAGR